MKKSAFDIIVGLFANNHSSFNDLMNWRINPSESSAIRDDIEFYIPQLCGYLIDDEKPPELRQRLFEVLVKASYACFYFSHRLYFFLQTYTCDSELSLNTVSVYY